MVSDEIQKAVNEQINAEFESAYIYLAFAEYFDSENLNGFAHWMRMQWQEELDHGLKFYDHLLKRGGRVELEQIDKPRVDASNPLEVFEKALEHERYITGRINDLYELAKQKRDNPLQNLLQWFIDEQVEEEETTEEIVEKLRLIGDHGPNLFLLDQELGNRQSEEDDHQQE